MPHVRTTKVTAGVPTVNVQSCRRCGKVFEGNLRRTTLALRLHERADHAGEPAPSEAESRDAADTAMDTVVARGSAMAAAAVKVAGPRAQRRRMARAALPSGAVGMLGALSEKYASDDEPQLDEDAPKLRM